MRLNGNGASDRIRVGEQIDDLELFNPEEFVEAMFEEG